MRKSLEQLQLERNAEAETEQRELDTIHEGGRSFYMGHDDIDSYETQRENNAKQTREKGHKNSGLGE